MKKKKTYLSLFLSVFLLSACEPKIEVMNLKGTTIKAEDYQHCNDTVPYGFPQHEYKDRTTYFLCHDKYTLEFNPYIIMPMWTAEHLYGKDLKEGENVEERFSRSKGGKDKGVRPDPKLPYVSGNPEFEYFEEASIAGFIPMKMVSIKNHLLDQREQSQTYYLTNYFPINKHNQNLIYKIEDYIREMIKKYDEGYVFTGPIYYGKPNNLLKIPLEKGKSLAVPNIVKGLEKENYASKDSGQGFLVPTYIFKMIYFPKMERTMTFIIPNKKVQDQDLNSYRQSLSTLEKLTKINFFPNLSREKKEKLLNQ